MWTNLPEEMREKAKLLKDNGYGYTGKWCEHICKNLHQYAKHPQMLKADFDDLFSTFKQEYLSRIDLGDRNLREKYLSIVQILLEGAIRNSRNPKQMFYELLPFAEQGVNANRTSSEVAKVFGNLDDRFLEARIYASLFVFMLQIEGVYFPTIRTLCGLKLAAEGKDVKFPIINDMSYDDIKRELGRFGAPLFLVYDDVGRKLRNAVAHANFEYKKEKLISWNIDQRTRKETWRKEFTYVELSAVSVDIYSISHAYLYWYMLRELVDKIAQHLRPT
jgi:hypothetical protein